MYVGGQFLMHPCFVDIRLLMLFPCLILSKTMQSTLCYQKSSPNSFLAFLSKVIGAVCGSGGKAGWLVTGRLLVRSRLLLDEC